MIGCLLGDNRLVEQRMKQQCCGICSHTIPSSLPANRSPNPMCSTTRRHFTRDIIFLATAQPHGSASPPGIGMLEGASEPCRHIFATWIEALPHGHASENMPPRPGCTVLALCCTVLLRLLWALGNEAKPAQPRRLQLQLAWGLQVQGPDRPLLPQ